MGKLTSFRDQFTETILCGDCQLDSSSWSATKGAYTFMDYTIQRNLWACNLVIRVKYIFTFHQEFCARFRNPPIKCLIPSFFPHSKTSRNSPSRQSGVQEIILVLQKESIMTQNSVMPMLKTVSTTSVYSHHYIEARSLIYNVNRKT